MTKYKRVDQCQVFDCPNIIKVGDEYITHPILKVCICMTCAKSSKSICRSVKVYKEVSKGMYVKDDGKKHTPKKYEDL